MKEKITMLWYRLFIFSLERLLKSMGTTQGYCGNKRWAEFHIGNNRIHVTRFDTREVDTYSRTEVLQMLRIVREQEKMMGWECPEPPIITLREAQEKLTETEGF